MHVHLSQGQLFSLTHCARALRVALQYFQMSVFSRSRTCIFIPRTIIFFGPLRASAARSASIFPNVLHMRTCCMFFYPKDNHFLWPILTLRASAARSASKCPFSAAIEHTDLPHLHPFFLSHFSIFKCPPFAAE
jgi:hypothetical protein